MYVLTACTENIKVYLQISKLLDQSLTNDKCMAGNVSYQKDWVVQNIELRAFSSRKSATIVTAMVTRNIQYSSKFTWNVIAYKSEQRGDLFL